MKQPYERVIADYGYVFEPIELLPFCKRVTIFGGTFEYQKARKKFLWFIPYTKWVCKDNIRWYPIETVEYYECSCGEEDECL